MTPYMEVKIDLEAKTTYIRLGYADIAHTQHFDGAESVLVDLDDEGGLIGIEILGFDTEIPVDRLAEAYGLSDQAWFTVRTREVGAFLNSLERDDTWTDLFTYDNVRKST